MADTQVLGTCVFGRVGSSPTSRTNFASIRQGRIRALSARSGISLTFSTTPT